MIRNLFILGLCSLCIVFHLHAKPTCSHKIKIKILRPILFDITNANGTSNHTDLMSSSRISNSLKLSWNHSIRDKKVTAVLQSDLQTDAFHIIADFKGSNTKQIRMLIDSCAKDLLLSDVDQAGSAQFNFKLDDLERLRTSTIAYTVTDAF